MMNCARGPATDCSSRSPRRIRLGASGTEHASQTADNRAIVMGVGIYEAGSRIAFLLAITSSSAVALLRSPTAMIRFRALRGAAAKIYRLTIS